MKDFSNAFSAIALLASAASACAMSPPVAAAARCQIVNGKELPAETGGDAALCQAIEQVVAAKGLGRFTVEVRVEPRSILTANVTLPDGRKLPELQIAEMDRAITKATFERLAAAIAEHVALAH